MPTSVPLTTKNPGDVLTSSLWNTQLKQNLDKLLNAGHRTLTVAQFGALTGLEGTKGVVAGDEVYLEVDATNGILWHIVYESTESVYKWRFLGGPPMAAEVVTAEGLNSAAYVALATAGPSVPLSRAGDYDIEVGCVATAASSAVSYTAYMSYDVGGTGAIDGDACQIPVYGGTGLQGGVGSRLRRKAAVAASSTITSKYKASNATPVVTFSNRWLRITPVRLV